MNYLEFLHKFVHAHSENFLQSFYAVVESSQIECLECPIEKTNTDNFLIKIYINNIIHNIRTFLLTCLSGSVGNILHNTEIDKQEICCYLEDDDNVVIYDVEKEESEEVVKNDKNLFNEFFNEKDDFLNKCMNVHNIRKSLQNAHVKTNDTFGLNDDILRYYIW
ncbi:hypothetical protein, conserved [Plasmodium gonderi]|uniref:Uncharacterized protein n=1 Tax=Plasmodium gonderi TaxID=77519 RepID=A0A1Y1JME9_PLAGO|nr:hypothetical protein, conserved [Plasmodium gonderi]GAW82387.1 hypothetical protein, conserved [Plasmodium gonderi]